MRLHILALAAIVVVLFLALTVSSFGKPGDDEIIINNADEVRTEYVVRSHSLEDTTTSIKPRTVVQYANEIRQAELASVPAALQSLLELVTERIIAQYANEIRHLELTNIPGALQSLLEQVTERIVVQYADDIRQLVLVHIPAQLQDVLGQAVDRVMIQYANENRTMDLAHPHGLIDDVTAPVISDIHTTAIGTTTATVLWLTDEFAASRIEYGVDPGSFPYSEDDSLYLKDHNLTITDLQPDTTHYFVIHCSDLNDNSAQSAIHSFTTSGENRPQYLPLITR